MPLTEVRTCRRRLTWDVEVLTVISTMTLMPEAALGWTPQLDEAWAAIGRPGVPGRAMRLDRGWTTVLQVIGEDPIRVRNIGADVAVGDWVVPSADGEKVDTVLTRQSAFVRRASHEGNRAEAHTLAANIDVVFLVHGLNSPPNQRRLERELVLAFDSGAKPVVILSKLDLVEDPAVIAKSVETLEEVALGVPVHAASGITHAGLETLRSYAADGRTMALLGASGVGKSTLINALVGNDALRTNDVRMGDQRGRHTTTAAELVSLPSGGWLLDTPGVRAVSLWLSGDGIERAFADVFDLTDHCRFRNCKHEDEPGCAVLAAIAAGTLPAVRLESLKRLVAEEAALEEEQKVHLRAGDKRGVHRPRTHNRF
ncbi:MAG: rsgA [Ilumatobacteraceae bacterium]|nr:rsgA [Ilumatobacteraceae bacterium]